MMTNAENISDAAPPHELRRRRDGTVDTDFYRRRAAEQRSEEIGRLLRLAAHAMRRWVAAAPALTRRGGQSILRASRDASAPLVTMRGDGRRA